MVAITPRLHLLDVALGFLGVAEIPGARHETRISRMLTSVGLGPADETAWCSAFVAHVAEICGVERSTSGLARSWLTVGKEADDPLPGHLVIFERGTKEWQGHVAFFLTRRGSQIFHLGGNQGNKVSVTSTPASKVLGCRELRWSDKL